MTLFLSAKQIVDLLYQFKFLDYLMVIFALGLIVYKAIKEYKASEENSFASFTVKAVKGHFCLSDALILTLAILTGLSLLRNLDGFPEACAIESAFLVYLLGRVYGKEVLKAGKYLADADGMVFVTDTGEQISIRELGVDKLKCELAPISFIRGGDNIGG